MTATMTQAQQAQQENRNPDGTYAPKAGQDQGDQALGHADLRGAKLKPVYPTKESWPEDIFAIQERNRRARANAEAQVEASGYQVRYGWMVGEWAFDDEDRLHGVVDVNDVWSDAGDKDSLRFEHGQLAETRERRNFRDGAWKPVRK
jgi:hypothetical protein